MSPEYEKKGIVLTSHSASARLRQVGTCRKVYLSAVELSRMRQSPGSSLLTAVMEALPEPLTLWEPADLGVDQQGMYELTMVWEACACASADQSTQVDCPERLHCAGRPLREERSSLDNPDPLKSVQGRLSEVT